MPKFDNMNTAMPSKYWGKSSFFGGEPILPTWSGYVIVVLFGVFFSGVTTGIMALEQKFSKQKVTSEFFNTAGRDIKLGLTAAVLVSQWTWAATLLQSSNVAWQFGVSGPFWYASGATIQILLFGILAIELKRRAPKAHTMPELVLVRWGGAAHKTFIFFTCLTSTIVTSMLLLGGAATMKALTGMNVYWANFLIPWGVIFYTAAGGLKATFLASYIHTGIIFLILLVMVYSVYVKDFSTDDIYNMLSDAIDHSWLECKAIYSAAYECDNTGFCGCRGSDGTLTLANCLDASKPSGIADTRYNVDDDDFSDDDGKALARTMFPCGGVAGNARGSYLTMLSKPGLMFGIINIIGNFGTVFVDQSYWQSAIAAKPSVAHKGYLLGGMVWFTIPFALATACGIASVALQLPITADEAGSGLVPPAIATYLYGTKGALMITIMLFMAIVSTGSAESMAVASVFAYDVYKVYFKPSANGEDIMRISRYVVVVFGLCMGVLGVVLFELKLNLGWVYLFMGIAIGSAVMPLWFLLTWKDASANGAVAAAWGGMVLAMVTWVSAAQATSGKVNIESLGTLEAMMSGNLVALISSGVIHWSHSKLYPQNYDWNTMRDIALLDETTSGLTAEDLDPAMLDEASKWVKKFGYGFTILIVIIWPILSTPAGVFTKDYFAFWVFVAITWGLAAATVIVVLPLYEARDSIANVCDGLFGTHFAPEEAMIINPDEEVALKGVNIKETL
ncbi:urea transporter [Pelagophyceae sp. CCMP2097]|nr:urea transporter [Pelagophyceae sp. CCMP2097]